MYNEIAVVLITASDYYTDFVVILLIVDLPQLL